MSSDILNQLAQIGLSGREAEVYMALLQRKEFTAPELTRITTITRTKIYEILQKLIHKGICTENIRNGSKIYYAIEPKIALRNIIINYEQIIEEKKLSYEQKQKTLIEQKRRAAEELGKKLTSLHKDNKNNKAPLDYVEVLTDLMHIRARWNELQKSARRQMLVFSKAPYSVTPEENMEDESSIIKNGVEYRTIYEFGGIKGKKRRKQFLDMTAGYQEIGEKLRVIETLPMKMAIIDEKLTMLALDDPVSLKPGITTMIINHPKFASSQKEVFEAFWNRGMVLEDFNKW